MVLQKVNWQLLYRYFGTTYRSHLQRSCSPRELLVPWKRDWKVRLQTSVTTNLRCVTSQKNERKNERTNVCWLCFALLCFVRFVLLCLLACFSFLGFACLFLFALLDCLLFFVRLLCFALLCFVLFSLFCFACLPAFLSLVFLACICLLCLAVCFYLFAYFALLCLLSCLIDAAQPSWETKPALS